MSRLYANGWQVGIMESPRSNDSHPPRGFAYYLLGNPERDTLPNAEEVARLIELCPELIRVAKQAINYLEAADEGGFVLEDLKAVVAKAEGSES